MWLWVRMGGCVYMCVNPHITWRLEWASACSVKNRISYPPPSSSLSPSVIHVQPTCIAHFVALFSSISDKTLEALGGFDFLGFVLVTSDHILDLAFTLLHDPTIPGC